MTVLDYLDRSAARFPEKTAFSDAEKALSYRELLDGSRRIAAALIRRLALNIF